MFMHPQMLLEASSGESGKNRYKIELYHNETVPAQSTFIESGLRRKLGEVFALVGYFIALSANFGWL